MKITEREYLVLLCSFIPFGPARIKLLTSYFGSAQKIWKIDKKKLIEVGLKDKLANDFVNFRDNLDIEDYFEKLKILEVDYTVFGDDNYPHNLSDIEDAPQVLFFKGSFKRADDKAIAIVGSRKMTSYGRGVTEKFVMELAGNGITIVSGLARGVDTVAHKTALSVGGRTLAIIASGLDRVYPPENTPLVNDIVTSGGSVISEYPLGYPPHSTNFPARNRIISGMSKAVLVVEGERKSGTLLTASAAAQQGRTVFAIPGEISSPTSGAPLFLIQNGAKLVVSTKDILDEMDLEVKVDRDRDH